MASLLRLCLSSMETNPFHIQFQQEAYQMCIKAVLTCLTIKSTIRLPTQSISNLHKILSNLSIPFTAEYNQKVVFHPCTSNYSEITRQMYLYNIVPFFMQILKLNLYARYINRKTLVKSLEKVTKHNGFLLHNITECNNLR